MELHDDIDNGEWVRLERDGSTVGLQRWPGPHRVGEIINTIGPGRYEFERTHDHADRQPEHVYRWTT